MDKIKIEINDKEFSLLVAKTEEEKTQGLSNTDSLPEDGMLFSVLDISLYDWGCIDVDDSEEKQ